VDAFSTRRAEIEAALAVVGASSRRAHEVAAVATRRAKDHAEAATLAGRWRERAASLRFAGAEVATCFGRAVSESLTPALTSRLLGRLGGPRGLTRMRSTFARREVI